MVAFYQAIYFLNGCIFELIFFLKLCFRYVSFVRLTVLTEKHFKTVEKHFRLSRSVQWTKFVHEVNFFSFGPEKTVIFIERIIQFLDSFFWLAFHMPHSKIPNCHFKCLLTGETLYIKWTLKESWNRSEKKTEQEKNSLPKINPSICETLSRLIRAFVEHILMTWFAWTLIVFAELLQLLLTFIH